MCRISGENTKICMLINVPQIEFKMEQCTIPDTYLNNPRVSIKAINRTQVILLLTDIIFSVFFAKIYS